MHLLVIMLFSASPKDPTSHLPLDRQTEAAEPKTTERKSKINIYFIRKLTGEARRVERCYLQ